VLEPCVTQAAGLQGLALQMAPRLIAVTSHGQQQGELPLLWGLCARWVDMGLSVMVLDGHTPETMKNPGLANLLNNPLDRAGDDDRQVSWKVLAAADGLKQLSSHDLLAGSMGELFKNFAVVLIYAGANDLSRLLKGSTLAPLLVVPPARSSTVTAYTALKQLLMNGRLRPTVANITLEPNMSMPAPTFLPVQQLMDCAANFLGYHISPIFIEASAKGGRSQSDVDHLALQLFENALLMEQRLTQRVH
jgi:hypothetical protein